MISLAILEKKPALVGFSNTSNSEVFDVFENLIRAYLLKTYQEIS